MRVLLAILIGSFEFKKVEGFQVEKYSLITMRPKNGLSLHVTRLSNGVNRRGANGIEIGIGVIVYF